MTDIFEVQDEVVEKIVGVLAVTLTQGEQSVCCGSQCLVVSLDMRT